MSGFAGLVDPTGAPVDRDLLTCMTRAVAARGPDAEGFFFGPGIGLGHRRLSVIDRSAGGAQPMGNEDGDVQLVLDGTIYNFLDLRAELMGFGHTFRTRSDTEVLLAAYIQWGSAVVSHLEGMYALVVWDGRKRQVFAARDRMGEKPLYYARIPRSGLPPLFAFGSQLKALAPVPGLDRSVCSGALDRYFRFAFVPAPLTIYEGARKLDAAECLQLSLTDDADLAPTVQRYWDVPRPPTHAPLRASDAAEALASLLVRAVEKRLVSDVPLGVYLSGSNPDAAVAATLRALLGSGHGIQTFSIAHSDPTCDTSVHARTAASFLGCIHHEQLLKPWAMRDVLPQVTRALDEPLADATVVSAFLLSRFARHHVTVALSGDGANELFAGHPRSASSRLALGMHRILRGEHLPDGWRRHQSSRVALLPNEHAALLSPDVRARADSDLFTFADLSTGQSVAPHEQALLPDPFVRMYLADDVNVKADRAASAVGLEVRAPFLDTDLVEFACRLPANLRGRVGWGPNLLRWAMRGRLPAHLLGRKTRGVAEVPVARWMKGDLLPMLKDELEPTKLAREGFFQPAEVTRVLDAHVSGRHDGHKALWALLCFERWLADHGPHTTPR
ncbi:MAG: asparagine synthase (glutamine-hydrolyzing) [Myxococcales bacterium]|nr:asparagine synthase (glutamine-hydrolyzing) [Myxococcales bacterium]